MQIFHRVLGAESFTVVWPVDASIQLIFLPAAAAAVTMPRGKDQALTSGANKMCCPARSQAERGTNRTGKVTERWFV